MKEPKYPQPKQTDNVGNFFNSLDWNESTTFENDDRSVHSSPHKSESPNSGSFANNNNQNIIIAQPDCDQAEEAVGNLLGDFDMEEDVRILNDTSSTQVPPASDVDGLADFFSGVYTSHNQSDEYSMISNDVDLFNGMKSHTNETTNNVNLLFFDSSTTDTNNKSDNFMFDPFGHNLVNSSSSRDITSNDWINTPVTCAQKQPPQPCMKPSNSTNSLLNITNSNPIKPSPSFHSNQTQSKPSGSDFNIFENITKDPHAALKKPVPPPKPAAEKKSFGEKSENVGSKKPKDAFKDLLGDFKPSEESTNGQRTMRDIRKEKLSKTTDPETMKVNLWAGFLGDDCNDGLSDSGLDRWEGEEYPGAAVHSTSHNMDGREVARG